MRFRLSSAGLTDVGRLRTENEDSFLRDTETGLYLLCDGMGGHASGAVASRLAVDTIAQALPRPASPGEPLVSAIQAANAAIFARSQADETCRGMGTTVVALRHDDAAVHICHVGDSRLYLFRQYQLRQVTRDHSLINLYADHPELVGKLGPAHSNVIVRAVGLHETVEVEHQRLLLENGDLFLCCSDGLSDMVEEWLIREVLMTSADLGHKTRELVRAAIDRGGADNVTVILARADAA
jgi:protein phosphatase